MRDAESRLADAILSQRLPPIRNPDEDAWPACRGPPPRLLAGAPVPARRGTEADDAPRYRRAAAAPRPPALPRRPSYRLHAWARGLESQPPRLASVAAGHRGRSAAPDHVRKPRRSPGQRQMVARRRLDPP